MQQRTGFLAMAVAALWPAMSVAQPPCRPDPGTRFGQSAELGEWERSRIAALAPRGQARLFLAECGFDCVEGVADPRAAYDATMEVSETAITFVLSANGTERGQIAFDWPETYTWFGTDTAPGEDSGADLYTEMRFSGAVTGRGDFAHEAPARAELVLSGFGNMCITKRSFSGWMLTVFDEGADYRLFGGLAEIGVK